METALNLIGLVLTGFGAGWAAWKAVINLEQSKALNSTYRDANQALYEALLVQSSGVRIGLCCVVIGTVLQVVALMLPVFVPGQRHTQDTASMALGSCQMDYLKNRKSIGEDNTAYLIDCMHSTGFSINYRAKYCDIRAAPYSFACYTADKKPRLIERIKALFV